MGARIARAAGDKPPPYCRMLRYLSVSDFALVRKVDLDLASGLTILTGETGAGKTILMDALGIVLGGKASAEDIRDGAPKAVIQAAFDPPPRALLEEAGLFDVLDPVSLEEVILVRELPRDGKGRATVNGRLVPVARLRELGTLLADLHGQGEHQSLLLPIWQLRYIDGYAGQRDRIAELAAHHARLRAVERERDECIAAHRDRDRRLASLTAERDELLRGKLRAGEEEQLLASRKALASRDRVMALVAEALGIVRGSEEGESRPSLHALLGRLERACTDLATLGAPEALRDAARFGSEARDRLREIEEELHKLSEAAFDPAELDRVEARLFEIDRLRRKYGTTVDGLLSRQAEVEAECATLENAGSRLQSLEKARSEALAAYLEVARAVSAARRKAAPRIAKEAVRLLADLSLPHAELAVELKHKAAPERAEAVVDGRTVGFDATGIDDVELLVSCNPGEPLRPLRKVASGGELSRIMLACKLLAAADEGPATLVFDEIDVGVSGGAAEAVGRKLRQLAERKQVLCITHLPQVACFGHSQIEVVKGLDSGRAVVEAHPLSDPARRQAIARLLAGATVTESALRHAGELLEIGKRG